VPLQVGPEQLDWIELRTVGGQIERCSPGRQQGLPDGSHFVEVQVVHDDDVARPQPRDQSLFDEVEKDIAVDGAVMRHELGAVTEPDGPDQREGLPGSKGAASADAFTARTPSVFAPHPRLAERFIQEDEPIGVRGQDELAELAPTAPVRFRVALRGYELLFFRE